MSCTRSIVSGVAILLSSSAFVSAAAHARCATQLRDASVPVLADIARDAATGWVVDRADNICGLDDPKMLSKPAKVDYDALLKATPEMKKIKDDKIDPSSPQGIQLKDAAATRVRNAADKVRTAEGYCSVWKQIRHQDGRAIPDITDLVKAQL